MLQILFGEYFYHLRAALDHAVDNRWSDPPPGEDILQFPICSTPESWRKNSYHVAPLNERHRGWIEQVQPSRGANEGDGERVDPRTTTFGSRVPDDVGSRFAPEQSLSASR